MTSGITPTESWRRWVLAGAYQGTLAHRPQLKALQAAILAGEVEAIALTDICEFA